MGSNIDFSVFSFENSKVILLALQCIMQATWPFKIVMVGNDSTKPVALYFFVPIVKTEMALELNFLWT